MVSIDDLVLFMKLAEVKSISGLSKLNNMSKITITKRLKLLEQILGKKLVIMNTRFFELTTDGLQLFDKLNQYSGNLIGLYNNIEELFDEKKEPTGSLKIVLPTLFALDVITPRLHEFILKYPKINLQVVYSSNSNLNLVQNSVNLAIVNDIPQVGNPKTSLVYKGFFKLYCSKKYKEKYGVPSQLNELKDHLVIGILNLINGEVLDVISAINTETKDICFINNPKRFAINNAVQSVKLLESDEMIVAMLNTSKDLISSDNFVEVLPQYVFQEIKFYLAYHDSYDAKTALFKKFLLEVIDDYKKNEIKNIIKI